MDVMSGEILFFLVILLGFGSSLIHYTAYAKEKAKVAVKTNKF